MHIQKKILAVVSMSFALVMFNMSIIAIAFPEISKTLHSSTFSNQWIINAYILSTVTLGLIIGKLSDMRNPKNILLIGLILFGISSIGCAISKAFGVFIFFRVLQGISSALLITPSIKMLAEFFKKDKFGYAIGIVSGFGSIGFIFSSLFGGVLVEYFGWHSFFILNVLFCLISITILLKIKLEKFHKNKIGFFDILGLIIISGSVFALVFAIMEGHSFGWSSLAIVGCLIISLILLCAFLFVEKSMISPIIQREILFNKVFITVNLITIFSETMYISVIFLVMYMRNILHFSPSETGWLIFPLYFLILCSNFISSFWINRNGAYYPTIISSIIVFVGYFVTLFTLSFLNYESILLLILCLGITLYVVNNSAKTLIIEISHQEYSGISLGILENTRYISATISFAILGSIVTYYKVNSVPDYFYHGFYGIVLLCTILSAVNIFLSLFLLKRKSLKIRLACTDY